MNELRDRKHPSGSRNGTMHGAESQSLIELRTVEQAAIALSVSKHTVRAWIARRRIGCVRLGRAVRIPASEIIRLIELGTVPALRERRP